MMENKPWTRAEVEAAPKGLSVFSDFYSTRGFRRLQRHSPYSHSQRSTTPGRKRQVIPVYQIVKNTTGEIIARLFFGGFKYILHKFYGQ